MDELDAPAWPPAPPKLSLDSLLARRATMPDSADRSAPAVAAPEVGSQPADQQVYEPPLVLPRLTFAAPAMPVLEALAFAGPGDVPTPTPEPVAEPAVAVSASPLQSAIDAAIQASTPAPAPVPAPKPLPPMPVLPARTVQNPAAPAASPTLLGAQAADRQLYIPPFVEPRLARVGVPAIAAMAVRVAMVAWVAVAVWQVVDARDRSVVQPVDRWFVVAGAVLGGLWLATAAWWSVRRAGNVHRLDGRSPGRVQAGVVWLFPAVWVAVMAVTLVRVESGISVDYPAITIVTGFVFLVSSGYRVVQRVFRSLVRMPPTATTIALYVCDVTAFGLVWWQVGSWWGADVDLSRVSALGQGALAAALVAVAAGTVAAVLVDGAAERSQRIRMLTLRTRYDHRMARMNGLDPMNPPTRYALMLARRAAERAAERPVARRSLDPGGPHERLVRMVAEQLEHGADPDFAKRVRELERHTDGMFVARLMSGQVDPYDEQPFPNGAPPPTRRLVQAELLRYLVVLGYLACAGAGAFFVLSVRAGSESRVDLARTLLQATAAGVPMLVALWGVRIAIEGRRAGVTGPWRVPAGAAAASAVVVALWYISGADGGAASVALLGVLTVAVELVLWRIGTVDRAVILRDSAGPLAAWMVAAPMALALFVASPMRLELGADWPVARTVFFAIVVGLAAAVSGGIAGVAMVQIEDALRAMTHAPMAATAPARVEAASEPALAPVAVPAAAAEPAPVHVATRR